jgi:phage terminase small subunit
MGTRRPSAPKGLTDRGRRFWRTVVAGYELEPDELELLVEICRLLDQVEALQAVLEQDGLTATGSVGQVRVHPAVGELRSSRALLGKLLAQLELPDPEGESLSTPTQARARKAARSRWERTARLREVRRRGA